jgi:hypothetical protein
VRGLREQTPGRSIIAPCVRAWAPGHAEKALRLCLLRMQTALPGAYCCSAAMPWTSSPRTTASGGAQPSGGGAAQLETRSSASWPPKPDALGC